MASWHRRFGPLAYRVWEASMMAEATYSTAEVWQLLRISKSTLFRWEKDGLITPPDRDLRQQRQYTIDHIREVGAWR